LIVGEFSRAQDYAQQGIDFADRDAFLYQQSHARTLLAAVLHETARWTEAERVFHKAEEIQKQREPTRPLLWSFWGFWYCDLLLSQGKYKEVQNRAYRTLEWITKWQWLIDIAIDHLSLGQAYLLQMQKEKTSDCDQAMYHLNQAIEGLRRAGEQDYLLRGLLAQAELYQYQRKWEKVWSNLNEAFEIAERGQMRLYIADCHLNTARLCLAEGKRDKAREHYEEAKKRVWDMGYHRRDPEVLFIQVELELAEGKGETAKDTLEKARKWIDEMNCHRWDFEIERLTVKLKLVK